MSILEKTDGLHGIPSGAAVEELPMEIVFADEDFNCRGKIAPIDVVNLAQSIAEIGLVQPITVRPYTKGPKGTKYQVVAGYRRYKAHQVNNAKVIKAIIVENLNDIDAKIINLTENLVRQELNLIQESKAVADLRYKGLTQHAIAARLNVSRGWVQMRMNVLSLPKPIQEEIEAGWIKSEHIQSLVTMNAQEQIEAVKYIKDRKLTEGERTRVKVTKATLKKDVKAKAYRDKKQINIMLDHILDNIGASLATRALAWAAGNISSEELFEDIEKLCDEAGKNYIPPRKDITM